MNDTGLAYVYKKDDNEHPEGIQLKYKGSFEEKEKILINIPGRFQRITVYSNGLIVDEEILIGEHIFRFNKPYTVAEPGVIEFSL